MQSVNDFANSIYYLWLAEAQAAGDIPMFDKQKPNAGDTAVKQLHAGDRAVNMRLEEARKRAATGGKTDKPDNSDYRNSHRFMK